MELETWEALDLDDSDLPSLIRRCKRPRSTTTSTAVHTPRSPNPEHLHHAPPPSYTRRLPIPGPAGAVQAAMIRKDLDRGNRDFSNHESGNDSVLSTQDYIRKAMDDDTAEFDDDFSRNPWLSALHFLGAEDGLIPSTPISSIKKCVNGDKVPQVVAVVKSSPPNGLGGLLLSLKDPTGTIGASIHHKVLSQSEFGKELIVGAVVILQEVAIFTPVKSAHYLNVTMRNLMKVFCQNKDSTSKLYKSAHPVKYAYPDYCQNARAVEKISTLLKSSQNDIEIQSLHMERTQFNNRDSTNTTPAQRGCINPSQHAYEEGPEDIIGTSITNGNDQAFANDANRGTNVDNLEGILLKDADNITSPLAETNTGERARGSQPLMSRATLPQWTDEQLDQLFGDEEGGCLF